MLRTLRGKSGPLLPPGSKATPSLFMEAASQQFSSDALTGRSSPLDRLSTSSRAIESNEQTRPQTEILSASRGLDTLRRGLRVLLSVGSLVEKGCGAEGLCHQRPAVGFSPRQFASSAAKFTGRHTGTDPERRVAVGRECISLCGTTNLVGLAFLCNLLFARF
jgi:hypothetical protein